MRNFFQNLSYKLGRFMYGRYGVDALGKCLFIFAIIFMLIGGWTESEFLTMLSWAFLFYSYFRMFSKNIYKRSAENQAYLTKTYKLRCWFARQKNMMAQRKTHHIYKCPTCRQKIRIPRGKGRIEIRCPKCNTTFIKKS